MYEANEGTYIRMLTPLNVRMHLKHISSDFPCPAITTVEQESECIRKNAHPALAMIDGMHSLTFKGVVSRDYTIEAWFS